MTQVPPAAPERVWPVGPLLIHKAPDGRRTVTADDAHRAKPDLGGRIRRSEPARARRFAFRVARLACAVTGVRDDVALDIARHGLERETELHELVGLWELEAELEAACAAQLAADLSSDSHQHLRLHRECVEARAVAAVIAALKPDAVVAATEATREALAAGCAKADVETVADELL